MDDIFETPRAKRWKNNKLKLTLADRNMAAIWWRQGHVTDVIAMNLGLGRDGECRVWNSMNKIRGIKGTP